MALTDKDRAEIAAMMAEAVVAAQVQGPAADDILPLIQSPHLSITPGPVRSRYSQIVLLDDAGVARWQLRARTSDLRTLLLNAYNAEPGRAISDPRKIEPITGPVER